MFFLWSILSISFKLYLCLRIHQSFSALRKIFCVCAQCISRAEFLGNHALQLALREKWAAVNFALNIRSLSSFCWRKLFVFSLSGKDLTFKNPRFAVENWLRLNRHFWKNCTKTIEFHTIIPRFWTQKWALISARSHSWLLERRSHSDKMSACSKRGSLKLWSSYYGWWSYTYWCIHIIHLQLSYQNYYLNYQLINVFRTLKANL